ncbi:MAG TPA: hypothetical protein VJ911_04035, partial [Cryomorphaceae bacterium]|nr:hypothetical protein [Cryomorphaceae bacterium]
MMRRLFLLVVLFLGITMVASAQFYSTQYRPPNQDWQFLQTPHFTFVYASGNDSTALRLGQLLESQYPKIQELVGGELTNFPIILNDYNDRSNGFVTPIHFRSEIELPPIKGKSLNPQTGNWLKNVGPHELVHALQFSNLGDYNIPQLVTIFSPDMARSFHSAIPSGIIEGIAVHHESKGVTENGGRGHYPYFTNQFNATFKSNQRWSMGELVIAPSDTRPFDRFYIGGYEFTAWLQNDYGADVTREALDFYMDWPILGYGVALRHATGEWPNKLYNKFETHQQNQLKNKEASETVITELNIPFKGSEIRRPNWITDSKLLFYGSFYNARPGFYTYNLDDNQMTQVITTNSTGDYRYTLSADRSQMVYSFYEADAIYDNTSNVELVQYDFDSNQKRQLTKNGRLYAPVFSGDSLLALQTQPVSSQLVSVDEATSENQSISQILSLGNDEIKAVAANPVNQQLAVVINKNGMQGLWIVEPNNLESELRGTPDIAFEDGSVFDPSWHPSGQQLLFSSDVSGSLQLYEYDLSDNTVQQVTDQPYNAFEGSYSPNGNRVAFVRQVKNERLPAVLSRSDFLNNPVSTNLWHYSHPKTATLQHDFVADSMAAASKSWQTGSYSSGLGWLKPRSIFPIFEEVSNQDVYEWGLAFHSNNLLTNQSYSFDLNFLEGRGWYDFTYQNKAFYPGFKARFFNQPGYTFLSADDVSVPYLRQERGFALSVPFQYRINQNIYTTSAFLEAEFRQSQLRFLDLSSNNLDSDFATISIANIYGQFNYRLQQNIRDLQPNSGVTVYGEVEHYLSAENAVFPNSQFISFNVPTGLQGGLFTYFSPLRRWNQSLRLGVQGITQTNSIYNPQNIVSNGFSEAVLPGSNNLLSINTRYTIPLTYVDNGGFLLPLHLSNIYLVAFSDTILDPTIPNWDQQSRSVFGLGVRARFRISNMSFELGVGLGYEPTRNKVQFFSGD